ncbi:YniB family protein [Pseudomonas fluorescens]
MDVKKETQAAKRLWRFGLIIAVVGFVFTLVSLLLGIYGYADLHGVDGLKRVVGIIYSNTQFPVLSTVWGIAAMPDLDTPIQLKNLGFFGEFVVFLVGAAMMGSASKTLGNIGEAAHAATQERRKEQIKKDQEKRIEEQQEKERKKDKDLS